MRLLRTAACATAMTLIGLTANAEKMPLWKSVGLWQIRVDSTLGHGCFLMAVYKQGSVLRIGSNPTAGNAYVIIGRDAWKSLEVGKDYALTMQFDSKPRWDVPARAARIGESVALFGSFDDANFLLEFARSHNLHVWYQGQQIMNLTLRGSRAAVVEMLNCQKQMKTARKGTTIDPFATGSPALDPPSLPQDDPFAQ